MGHSDLNLVVENSVVYKSEPSLWVQQGKPGYYLEDSHHKSTDVGHHLQGVIFLC